jgi:hypothetical protein
MSDDQILTKQWLTKKLEADRLAEKKATEEHSTEEVREQARQAYLETAGVEPTQTELDELVLELRSQQTLERMAANRRQATRQGLQRF